jgi:hypothetical protein
VVDVGFDQGVGSDHGGACERWWVGGECHCGEAGDSWRENAMVGGPMDFMVLNLRDSGDPLWRLAGQG